MLKHKAVEVTVEEVDRIAALEGSVFKDPNVHNMLSDIKAFLTWEASKSAAGDPVASVEAVVADQCMVAVAGTRQSCEEGSDHTEQEEEKEAAALAGVF